MVGDVQIGGGAPISVQTMTTTKTHDVEATLGEIHQLADAGADIVRVAVPRPEDAAALDDGLLHQAVAGQAVVVVDGGAHQVEPMALVHVDGDPVDFKLAVLLALLVEAQHIAHSGATAALHADAQPVSVRNFFRLHDLLDLARRGGADADGCILRRLCSRVSHDEIEGGFEIGTGVSLQAINPCGPTINAAG